jgi:hypothetical protein
MLERAIAGRSIDKPQVVLLLLSVSAQKESATVVLPLQMSAFAPTVASDATTRLTSCERAASPSHAEHRAGVPNQCEHHGGAYFKTNMGININTIGKVAPRRAVVASASSVIRPSSQTPIAGRHGRPASTTRPDDSSGLGAFGLRGVPLRRLRHRKILASETPQQL